MGRRRCCCECYEFTDNFNRADNTDVGSDWEECTGDWQIWGSQLRGCDAGAIITLKHMVGDQVGHLDTKIHIREQNVPAGPYDFTSVGAKYRILMFYGTESTPCTSTDHWTAELEILTNTTGTLRLLDPDDVEWMSSPCTFSGTFTDLNVCVSNEEIEVSCADADFTIYGCPDPIDGFYFALESGTATCTVWDDVYYQDHYDHNSVCPDCVIPCCCPCIESQRDLITLLATIYAPDCPGMHGQTTTLTGSAALPECALWLADQPLGFQCPNDVGEGCEPFLDYELDLALTCNVTGCEGYELTVTWPLGSDNYAYCWDQGWTNEAGIITRVIPAPMPDPPCSCDPFFLQFALGGLWMNPSVLVDCCKCCDKDVYIIFTEAP